ncbi:Z-ring associated protein ZapG [Vibrio sp.]|nr:Z-ring associated protein ZapG [Vibrio sp.]
MPWIFAVVGLLIGIGVGFLVARSKASNYKDQKDLQKELDTAKYQLAQQQQEIADHFAQTANLVHSLGDNYKKLYQHLSQSSNDLIANQTAQDNPFVKMPDSQTVTSDDSQIQTESESEAPRDYANGATGLLREEEKVIIQADEAVTEKKA